MKKLLALLVICLGATGCRREVEQPAENAPTLAWRVVGSQLHAMDDDARGVTCYYEVQSGGLACVKTR